MEKSNILNKYYLKFKQEATQEVYLYFLKKRISRSLDLLYKIDSIVSKIDSCKKVPRWSKFNTMGISNR